MIKIFSGLLFFLITIVGIKIFPSGMIVPDTQQPPSRESPPQESSFLTRLPLLPNTSASPPLIAVVIENHEQARPFQRGLDRAVLISEFLVEGLISRFVALFAINNLPEYIGPVRSIRPYFIDALEPWTSLFLYAGGSPDALEKIEQTHTPHINGLFLPKHFIRFPAIAEPHNLFLPKNAIIDLIKNSSLTNRDPLMFSREPMSSDRYAQKIHVNFFNPDHNVTFTYDQMTASYIRMNGSIQTNTAPQNILILEAPIKRVASYGRLDIPLHGTGTLLFFQSGKMMEGRWQKNVTEPFVFTDISNKPLPFSNGQIWMMVLETLDRVKWE